MKSNSLTISALFVLAAFAMPSLAIEAPDEGADPEVPKNAPEPEIVEAAEAKRAYLGVYSQPVPEMLRAHLPDLEGGAILRRVMEGTPAEGAGLAEFDILLKLGDLKIDGPMDVRRAVMEKQPGDKVTLEFLRGGKKETVDLELGERPEMPRLADRGMPFRLLENGGIGGDPLEQLEDVIPRKELKRLREQLQLQIQPGNGPREQQFQFKMNFDGMQRSVTREFSDEEGKIKLQSNGDSTSLFLYDNEGKLLFEGPFDTEDDLEAIPDDQLKRLKEHDLEPGDDGIEGNFEFNMIPQP